MVGDTWFIKGSPLAFYGQFFPTVRGFNTYIFRFVPSKIYVLSIIPPETVRYCALYFWGALSDWTAKRVVGKSSTAII